MPTPNEIYPFSTQDGKSIPVDIIKPSAALVVSLTSTFSDITLTDQYNLAALFCTQHALIDLTGVGPALVLGTSYADWLFLPQNTVVMAVLPTAAIKARAYSTGGTLFIQGIQKWAGLALPRQFVGKAS